MATPGAPLIGVENLEKEARGWYGGAVGMIGMGRQAYYSNVKSFLGFPDVQVVAVCDVDAWRLARFQLR